MPFLPILIAAAAIGQAQQDAKLDKKIAFRSYACGLVTVTKNLSAATGLKLEADPVLKRQIVLIGVKDASVGDVLKKLADVTDCEWSVDEKGRHLHISPEKRRASYQQELKERADEIEAMISQFRTLSEGEYSAKNMANYLREQIRKVRDRANNYDRATMVLGPMEEYGGAHPAGRLMAQAIVSLNPMEVASMQNDERVVYSTKPTPKQRQLKVDVAALGKRLASDNTVFKEAIKVANLSKEEFDLFDRSITIEQDPSASKPRVASKAVLVLSRSETFGASGITAEFNLYDKEGATIETHRSTLWMDMQLASLMMGVESPSKDTQVKAREDSIWHRNQILQVDSGLENETDSKKPDKPDPRVESILRHPERSEPLSFFTSDLIIAASEQQNKNVIAELGDNSILIGYLDVGKSNSFEALTTKLEQSLFRDLSNDDRWRLWRTKRVTDERLGQLDRTVLANYLSSRRTKATTELEDKALYAWTRKSLSSINLVELVYGQLMESKERAGSMLMGEQWRNPALLFIGSLDTSTRSSLFNGMNLTYGRLGDTQKHLLDQIVYGETGSKTYLSLGPIWSKNPQLEEPDDFVADTDPTVVCPSGVPYSSTVQLQRVEAPQLYAPTDPTGKVSGWNPIDPGTIAWAIAVQKKPELARGGAGVAIPKKFKLGSLTTFKLVLWVGPKQYFGYTSVEQNAVLGAQELSLSQLPPEILKAIDAQVKDMMNYDPKDDGGGGQ